MKDKESVKKEIDFLKQIVKSNKKEIEKNKQIIKLLKQKQELEENLKLLKGEIK